MSVEAKVIWDTGEQHLKKLTAMVRQFAKETNLSEKEVKELEDSLDKMGKSGSANTKKVQGEMNNLNMIGKKVGGTLLAVFAVDRLIDYQKQIIEVTAEYQRMGAVLNTALGSRSSAMLAMTQMQLLASKTPFDVRRWTQSYVQLVNRGIEPSNSALIAMGDLSSAVGKEIDQLVEAILDVSNTERWTELGVKVRSEGDKIIGTFKGITVEEERTEKGALRMVEAFGKMEGVAGAMEGISETLGGRLSNLGDAIEQFFVKMGDVEGGAFQVVPEALTDMFNAFTEALTTGSEKARMAAAALFAEMRENFTDLKTVEDYKNKIEELTETLGKLSDQFDEDNEAYVEQKNILERHSGIVSKMNGDYDLYKQKLEEASDTMGDTKAEFLATEEAIKFLTRQMKVLNRETNQTNLEWKDLTITLSDTDWDLDQVRKSKKDLEDLKDAISSIDEGIYPDLQFDDEVAAMMDGAVEAVEDSEFVEANERMVERTKNEWDALIEHRQQIAQGLLDIAYELSNSLFAINEEDRQREYDAIDANEQRKLELAGENESRKAEIAEEAEAQRRQLEKQQEEAQKKAFLFQQALALTSTIINTSSAVVAALTPPPIGLGPVAGLPLAGIIGVKGALEAGVIAAQSIPAFAEGTERLEGPGTETSDSILLWGSKNERIVDAAKNKQIGYDMSNEDLVEAAKLYRSLPGQLKGNLLEIVSGKSGGSSINEERLAKEISAPIVKQLKNQKGVSVTVDSHGATLSVIKDMERITYLGERYGIKIGQS